MKPYQREASTPQQGQGANASMGMGRFTPGPQQQLLQQHQQQQLQQQQQQLEQPVPRTNMMQNRDQGHNSSGSLYGNTSTAGVFPSKPLNMAGNPGQQTQQRPSSAIFPPTPASPRNTTNQSQASASGYPVPAPRSAQAPMPIRPDVRQVQSQYHYYPSLSGSETDVSTSTENLTQVSD